MWWFDPMEMMNQLNLAMKCPEDVKKVQHHFVLTWCHTAIREGENNFHWDMIALDSFVNKYQQPDQRTSNLYNQYPSVIVLNVVLSICLRYLLRLNVMNTWCMQRQFNMVHQWLRQRLFAAMNNLQGNQWYYTDR